MDEDEEKVSESVLKIVVCGDGASGKTSLCTRLTQATFAPQYVQVS